MTAWPERDRPASPPTDDSPPPPADDERDPRVRWGLGDVWAGLVVAVIGSNIMGLVWLAATGNLATPDELGDAPIEVSALLQMGLWVGLLGAPLHATYRKGRRSLGADFAFVAHLRDIPLGAVAGLVTQLAIIPIIYIPIFRFVDDDDLGAPARDLAEKADGAGVLLLVAVVVIGAPVIEELFFRGLMLRAFERRFGAAVAVGASAVLFGLVHFQLLQLPALIAMGAVMGVLVVRTGRLGPAIWAHVVFNGTAVVVQLVG